MAGVLKEPGTACTSRAPGLNPDIWWIRITYLFSCLCCFVFYLSSSWVSCIQCCQCFWIVHSWLLLRFSRTSIWVCGPKTVRNIKKKRLWRLSSWNVLLFIKCKKIYIIISIYIHVYHFCKTKYILVNWIFNN